MAGSLIHVLFNIVHVYYMKNPVDFDKHVSELDFVQYKVRKKQRSKAIIFFIVALTTHRLVYDQDDQFY